MIKSRSSARAVCSRGVSGSSMPNGFLIHWVDGVAGPKCSMGLGDVCRIGA